MIGSRIRLTAFCICFAALITAACRSVRAAPIDDFVNSPYIAPTWNVEDVNIAAARNAYGKGKFDECRAHLRIARKKTPNLPPADLMLARLHFANGRIAQGRQLLEKVAAANPNHPEVYLLFGNLALGEGRLTDAQLHFEKALSVKPPAIWPDQQRDALQRESYLGQASVAEKREDWFEAQVALTQVTKVDPGNADVRDRLGTALFMLGRVQEAAEQFATAARQDPTQNKPTVSIAILLARRGRNEEARNVFAETVKRYPDDAGVHYEFANMLILLDEADQAKVHADKAAELGMDSLQLCMLRGYIARQLGQYDAAESHFEQAVDRSPTHFEAMNQLALVLSEQDDPAKRNRALELATLNARRYPKSSYATSTLGWVYHNLGRRNEAQRALLVAAAQPPVRSETLYFLARVLWENGSQDDARKVAKQVKLAIDQPGLIVLRPAIKKWMEETALN